MKKIALLVFYFACISAGYSQTFSATEKQEMCARIAVACQRSWDAYKGYANGFDALKPISLHGRNWYGKSLLMTPVDAFDTFIIMGLKKEAQQARQMILTKLNFNVDAEVQVFEVNIRLVGGLLSAYQLTRDKQFLNLAVDLGKRLLPAFKSPTGMPYRFVHLQTGKTRDEKNNPAEIGTCLLEFGKLTQYSGDSTFYKTAKKAALEVFRRRSDLDLAGTVIDVNTGEWLNSECQIGARIDSYFEYLYKASVLFGDRELFEAWKLHHKAIMKYMFTKEPTGCFFTRVDMRSGKETHPLYGALDAFYPGILALSGDTSNAACIQQGNYYMWTHFKTEPEEFNFRTNEITDGGYALRPENIESCFYLYRKTHNDKYLRMGKQMVDDILKYCRTDKAYASVEDVRTMKLSDTMESFFFAETLKYAWLLFAPENIIDLDKGVFSTEAHFFNKPGN